MKRNVGNMIVAMSAAAFAFVILPLQTYLGNTSAYAYGVGRLLAEQAVVAILFGAVAYSVMRVGDRWAKGFVAAAVTAILAGAYVESGLLAFGLPEINGELPDSLDDAARKIWDGAALALIAGGILVSYRLTRNWLHWVAAAILIMGIASLFDVRKDEAADADAKGGGYELSADIISNVEYSPTRNILLFVLDNVDSKIAADIVRNNPKLAAEFPGFVAYRNNIGMHDSTKLGVPGFMTGKYFEPGPGQLAKYILSVFGPDSFLTTYREHGDAIYAMFCMCSYGYTTAKIAADKRSVKCGDSGPVILRKTAEVPYLTLLDATLFRSLPFVFKRQFLSTKLRQRDVIWDVSRKYDYEQVVYPILATRPISGESRQMLAKFHTHGAHGPYEEGITDFRQATSNALSQLGKLMEAYRKRGIYDKSMIAVIADHGCGQYCESKDEPPKLRAMLWIKPEGANAPFDVSEIPTSHATIANVMRQACTNRLTRADFDRLLFMKDRHYRNRDMDDRHSCFDWVVHEDGSIEKR